ncbi:hypothetical protein Cha6605_3346 [Chamaesiphon minutus PCC 6605]|uniref:Uncharacterized protein n=1 Tax=Chamaesiphon minutus (strain ATCC 27169 / PCC 6605) TaxID=1173020 RepID=K9UI82_CHAP6|nr:hypothetical protein Cha6605_3346 [Chamaesiphon minutus PCC 6605]
MCDRVVGVGLCWKYSLLTAMLEQTRPTPLVSTLDFRMKFPKIYVR